MDLSIACLITLNRYSLLAILGTHLPWNDKRSLTLKLCSSLLFLELLSCVFRTFCSFLLTPVATIHVLTHLVKLQPELFFSVWIRDNTVWQYIYFGTLLLHNCTWVIHLWVSLCMLTKHSSNSTQLLPNPFSVNRVCNITLGTKLQPYFS